MMVALRDPNEYRVVFAVQRGEGTTPTRIDIGLTALLDDLRETVRRESAALEGDTA